MLTNKSQMAGVEGIDGDMSKKIRSRTKDFHSGYSPVLLRTELKDELKKFRRDKGWGHDSHIERCLMSAAIEMLLKTPELHPRWIEMLADATRQDVMLTSQAQIRGT